LKTLHLVAVEGVADIATDVECLSHDDGAIVVARDRCLGNDSEVDDTDAILARSQTRRRLGIGIRQLVNVCNEDIYALLVPVANFVK
jgi:hypothetical protein